MWKEAKTFVAEPNAMLGRAIIRAIRCRDSNATILDSSQVDLACWSEVERFFATTRPTHVFVAAGKKGGIQANRRFPADLMLNNLRVATNVIEAALQYNVSKLLYVASACVYPRDCQQPMEEKALLTGPFEPTNEAYSVSKLAGLKLCQAIQQQHGRNFMAAIPTNIYGPYDDFDPDIAHVIAALICRMQRAKEERQPEVVIWGTGNPRREFLYCDDFGDACVYLMETYSDRDPINIGSGTTMSIRDLAEGISQAVGYEGRLHFDTDKPDGMPHKALECLRLSVLGWRPNVPFAEGLRRTVAWYVEQHDQSKHEKKQLVRTRSVAR